jgi:hypothetical protein
MTVPGNNETKATGWHFVLTLPAIAHNQVFFSNSDLYQCIIYVAGELEHN